MRPFPWIDAESIASYPGHLLQKAAAATLYVPLGQGRGRIELSGQYVPAGHQPKVFIYFFKRKKIWGVLQSFIGS